MELGEEFDPKEIELRKSLRINTLKIPEKELLERLNKKSVKLQRIAFLKHGFFYEAIFSMGATPEYLQGYYYLQEAASQIPSEVLNPKAGEMVLDMSAAPGSKTTQMSAQMGNKGTLVAIDNNIHRLESLRSNIERLGVENVTIFRKDARFVDDLNLKFDKVLFDAPCSGNFTDDKNWFEQRDLQGIKERARLQREILKTAVRVLKKGGVLVYSTCTLEPEENELNIDWLLKKYENLTLEETGVSIGDGGLTKVFGEQLNPEIKKCKRLWPHKTGTQGFFIAKLRKN
ncbi:MAG: RsmB/NOP family class I SAM-dependent RNA methyltransferase [archaeon]